MIETFNTPDESLPNRDGKDKEYKDIYPNFELKNLGISPEDIKAEAGKIGSTSEIVRHKEILTRLKSQIDKVDFRTLAGLKAEEEKLEKKHYLVICVEQVLNIARKNNWGICKNHSFVYVYNGFYWNLIDKEELETFLGDAAEKMGVYRFDARHYTFRENLYKQFMAFAIPPRPEQSPETVFVNLKNGTFEITPDRQELRTHNHQDFITYQLPFDYDPNAKAPIWEAYLNKVQPDIKRQMILAEYLGYLFIKSSTLKLEKTLLLYGSGANGKSVFFEVVYALLGGDENVSNYTLQSLTNESGYQRAKLGNKLVNYASEINGKLETSMFKQLVSGEPVEARLPYGEPFTLTDYAKFIFNCNELPKEVEQTKAYYRRFEIVPFDITIPEEEQDKQLHQKIIKVELSGIFNWVLGGLRRLLENKNFTYSEAVSNQLERYKTQSDSVQLFLEEEGYSKSLEDSMSFKDLYAEYRPYCILNGYYPVSNKSFGERLRNASFEVKKMNQGLIVFVKKLSF